MVWRRHPQARHSTLDGCAVSPRRMLIAANTYRIANRLPPFSVRGL